MAVLFLFLSMSLQAQVLEKKITLHEDRIELGQALKKLKQNFGVKLSYANNAIPEKKIISIDVKEVSLKEVLDKLFIGTNVSYQLIGDQIVLKSDKKKEVKKISKAIKEDSSKTQPLNQNVPTQNETVNNEETVLPDTSQTTVVQEIKPGPTPSQKELRRAYRLEKKRLKYSYMLKRDSLYRMENTPGTANQQRWNETVQNLKREIREIRDSIQQGSYKLFPPAKADSSRSKTDSASAPLSGDSIHYETRPAQVTFVSPIGTNGIRCGRIVNGVSLNILGGYSAGLQGFEFGGLVNLERDYVHGAQFAGLVNLVRNQVNGGQFSGLVNVAGRRVKGGQFAGLINVAGDSVTGAQFAGLINATHGSFKGVQGAGLCNVVTGNFHGPQFGFINVTAKEHRGTQVGFINYSSKLKGAQIGFLNVCDSAQGIPVGFLSIVRHGYHKMELYGGESMYGNVALKTGVRHFYNILYAGGEVSSNYYRWAFGYGIGTEHAIGDRINLGLDLIAMHVNENQAFTAKLNLLNQARLNLGVAISRSASLFAGPTFNVMVSQYVNPDYTFGSKLGKGQLYNSTTGSTPTNIRMWIGFNGGIRF
ncbi:MAG: STN domain-containing protein [Cytophagaceae bacterium]